VKGQLVKQDTTPDCHEIGEFDVDVEYIEELITQIENPYTRESLTNRYVSLHYSCKKSPVEKAISYDIFRAMV